MNRKVAIIDPLGAHGSSHHFYLFGQAEGLLKNDLDVSLYTNNETPSPKINGLKFLLFIMRYLKVNPELLVELNGLLVQFFRFFMPDFQEFLFFIFIFFILMF